MGKILEMLGLGKLEYQLDDFEPKLRNHYLKNFCLDIALVIFCIVFMLTTGYVKGVLLFAGILAFLILYHIYSIMLLLCGKVYCLEGTVMKEEKKYLSESITPQKSLTILGRSYIIIKAESNLLYNVPVGHISKYETGDTVKVYFNEGSVLNTDSQKVFNVLNPILVYRNKMTIENASEDEND